MINRILGISFVSLSFFETNIDCVGQFTLGLYPKRTTDPPTTKSSSKQYFNKSPIFNYETNYEAMAESK